MGVSARNIYYPGLCSERECCGESKDGRMFWTPCGRRGRYISNGADDYIYGIQFYDEDSCEVTVDFLSVDNLLDKHDSANAAVLFQTIQCNLQECTVSFH